jgi:acetyl-CoA C-acetyltransferase
MGLDTALVGDVTLGCGVDAIATTAAKVDAGVEQLAVAGGVESMSRVPLFADGGPLFADPEVAGAAGFVHMGVAADVVATLASISRDECDEYALESHRRAAAARDAGRSDGSLVPVHGPDGELLLDRDETVRDGQTLEALGALEPAFEGLARDGVAELVQRALPELGPLRHVHTVGTAPQIVDGASLVLLGSREQARALGAEPRARVVSAANAGVQPPLLTATVPASERALARTGMTIADVDLFEVNESFAATVLHYLRELDLDPGRVNVNGGAIAAGHPLGATGGILLATLLDELERRDLEIGLLTIPAAAGIGAALVVQRV